MPDQISREELLASVNAAASHQKAKMDKKKKEEAEKAKGKIQIGGPVVIAIGALAFLFTFGYIMFQSTHPPPPPIVKLFDLKENNGQLVGHISNTTKKNLREKTWLINYLDGSGKVVVSQELTLKDVKAGETREWTVELGSSWKPGLTRKVKDKSAD